MIDCLILGDSIAVGTHMARPECVAYAKGGINTWQFNKMYAGEFYSGIVIISLGTNDHKFVKTKAELEALRARVTAKSRVYWILPSANLPASAVSIESINSIITDIAAKHNDVIIKLDAKHLSKDGIHPTGMGYRYIANTAK